MVACQVQGEPQNHLTGFQGKSTCKPIAQPVGRCQPTCQKIFTRSSDFLSNPGSEKRQRRGWRKSCPTGAARSACPASGVRRSSATGRPVANTRSKAASVVMFMADGGRCTGATRPSPDARSLASGTIAASVSVRSRRRSARHGTGSPIPRACARITRGSVHAARTCAPCPHSSASRSCPRSPSGPSGSTGRAIRTARPAKIRRRPWSLPALRCGASHEVQRNARSSHRHGRNAKRRQRYGARQCAM